MIGTGLPAPTVAEALRLDLLVQCGCLACWMFAELFTPPEVHHLTEGGKHGQVRRGHAYTLAFCPWHHRGVFEPRQAALIGVEAAAGMVEVAGPSYARQPSAFRRTFGADGSLLAVQSRHLARVASTYLIHPGRYADPAMPGGFAP